jgi:hypothetical protein
MPEKTPGGPLPSQTGTTEKGAPAPGKSTAPVGKPMDKSGKDGGGKK